MVLDKKYVSIHFNVKSLTHVFPIAKTMIEVEKKVDKIRMIYDATKSRLYEAVWAQWFSFPTVDCQLRAVESDTFMADCDVGEIF